MRLAQPRGGRLRFRDLDAYRAEREVQRYEGTPQRDLFRELRERFLARHKVEAAWAVDVGSGPSRFAPWIGGANTRRVALDLSRSMLEADPTGSPARTPVPGGRTEKIVGDAVRPPLAPGAWDEVVVLGNTLGFAGDAGPDLLDEVERLLAPNGHLLVEIAPAPGERSRYLARLPPGSVGRLLEAPPALVVPRVEREGFQREPRRHAPHGFRRWKPGELVERWAARKWRVLEVMAVAPALGADAIRVAHVARSQKGWSRLLEVEERLGRKGDRWGDAAAVLLAVTRTKDPDL